MPRPNKRSTHLRKVSKKLPGGRVKIAFSKKKPSKAVCASCKKVLSGVPRDIPARIRKLAKTQRRPERPYGGVLCNICTRKQVVEKAKNMIAQLMVKK